MSQLKLSHANDLAEFMELPLEVRDGANAIAAFAAAHSRYVEHDEEGGALIFRTEDVSFIIHHDLDEKLDVVFGGCIRSFCPQRDVFVSEYRSSIQEVVADLKENYGKFLDLELQRYLRKVPRAKKTASSTKSKKAGHEKA